MQPILAYLEINQKDICKSSLETITIALDIAEKRGTEVIGFLCGNLNNESLSTLAEYGLKKLVYVETEKQDSHEQNFTSEMIRQTVQDIEPTLIIGHVSKLSCNVLPNVAGILQIPIFSDCTGYNQVDHSLKITKPLFGARIHGNISLDLTQKAILVFRSNTKEIRKRSPVPIEIQKINAETLPDSAFRLIRRETGIIEDTDIRDAEIIVSGGRGMRDTQGFEILNELANRLNGGLGGSRAVVDAGMLEHNHQVGQTGKTVSPKLYLAFGISGTIQHAAGMKTSKVIVAINNDPDALIFKFAHYGIIADAKQVAQALVDKLRA